MNTLHRLLALASLALAAFATPATAHEAVTPGPNGGRLLTNVEPRAEFFVTPERKVQITFVDKAGKAIAPAAQVVTVTAGERSAPVTLTFTKTGDTLLSTATLPAGNDFPTVVQIKPTPESKAAVTRFNLNLSVCGECKNPEYACTCAH